MVGVTSCMTSTAAWTSEIRVAWVASSSAASSMQATAEEARMPGPFETRNRSSSPKATDCSAKVGSTDHTAAAEALTAYALGGRDAGDAGVTAPAMPGLSAYQTVEITPRASRGEKAASPVS